MSTTVLMRSLFYVNKDRWLNRAIAAATWPMNRDTEPASHCSQWEPNGNGGLFDSGTYRKPQEAWTRRFFWGQCWTSTTRKAYPGDKAGTKVRPAAGVLDHPKNWLYVEYEVRRFDFEHARELAQKRVDNNKGYAYSELLRYVMPFWLFKRTPFYDPDREKCSPHVEQWLFDMGILPNIRLRSPRRLCKDLVLATEQPLRRLVDDVIVRDAGWQKLNPAIRKLVMEYERRSKGM